VKVDDSTPVILIVAVLSGNGKISLFVPKHPYLKKNRKNCLDISANTYLGTHRVLSREEVKDFANV